MIDIRNVERLSLFKVWVLCICGHNEDRYIYSICKNEWQLTELLNGGYLNILKPMTSDPELDVNLGLYLVNRFRTIAMLSQLHKHTSNDNNRIYITGWFVYLLTG